MRCHVEHWRLDRQQQSVLLCINVVCIDVGGHNLSSKITAECAVNMPFGDDRVPTIQTVYIQIKIARSTLKGWCGLKRECGKSVCQIALPIMLLRHVEWESLHVAVSKGESLQNQKCIASTFGR